MQPGRISHFPGARTPTGRILRNGGAKGILLRWRDRSGECERVDLMRFLTAEQIQGAREALEWYEDYSKALGRDFPLKKTDAVLASVTALSLDGGERARKALAALSRQPVRHNEQDREAPGAQTKARRIEPPQSQNILNRRVRQMFIPFTSFSDTDEKALRIVRRSPAWSLSRLRYLVSLARAGFTVHEMAVATGSARPTVDNKITALRAAGCDVEARGQA